MINKTDILEHSAISMAALNTNSLCPAETFHIYGNRSARRKLTRLLKKLGFETLTLCKTFKKALVLSTLGITAILHPHIAKGNDAIDANTLPQNATVKSGNVVIDVDDAVMNITAGSKAIVDWQSFSIGKDAQVDINNNGGITLNRVTGNSLSHIYGQLTSNGEVILINQNGIVFGKNARVDVNGLIATTADINDQDFLDGNYNFAKGGKDNAQIINEGLIEIQNQGLAAFVAPTVINKASGTIIAKLGKVSLASGNTWTLDAGGLVKLAVDDKVAGQLIQQGKLTADGGIVQLASNQIKGMVQNAIEIYGNVQTQTVSVGTDPDNLGAIIIDGGDHGIVEIGGTLDASGKASGQSGGAIHITSKDRIRVKGEDANASIITVEGDVGGGEIIIGGEYLGGKNLAEGQTYSGNINAEALDKHLGGYSTVNGSALGEYLANYYTLRNGLNNAKALILENGSLINASALTHGNAGRVIAWADDATKFYNTILATGGSLGGDGGFVETSGKAWLAAAGDVNVGSTNGESGTWLLDPYNLTITDNSGTDVNVSSFAATGTGSILDLQNLYDALDAGNVNVTTGVSGSEEGDITFASVFNHSFSNTLTLTAADDIIFNASYTNSGTGGLTFSPGDTVFMNADVTTNSAYMGGSTDTINIASGVTWNVNNATIYGNIDAYGDINGTGVFYALGNTNFYDGSSVTAGAIGTGSASKLIQINGTVNFDLGNLTHNSAEIQINSGGHLIVEGNYFSSAGEINGNGANTTLTFLGETGNTINAGNGITSGISLNSTELGNIDVTNLVLGGTSTTIDIGDLTLGSTSAAVSASASTVTAEGTLSQATTITADTLTIDTDGVTANQDLTLNIDELTLTGAIDSDVAGTNILTIATKTDATEANFGNGDTTGLNISETDINTKLGASTSFATYAFGDSSMTGNTDIGNITVDGALNILGGTVNLNGALDSGTNTTTITANTASTGAINVTGASSVTDDLTLIADVMDIAAALTGSGSSDSVTVKATTASRDIELNSGSSSNLALATSEIGNLIFDTLNFGDSTTTGTINFGDITTTSALDFEAAGGIQGNGTLSASTLTFEDGVTATGNLTLNTDELTVNGNIDSNTANQNTLTIATKTASTDMNIGNGVTTGLDIANTTIQNNIGASKAFQTLAFGSTAMTGTTNIGSLTYSKSNLIVKGDEVALSGNVNIGSKSLDIIADDGNISRSAGTLTGDDITLDATGTIFADVDAQSLDINNATAATLTGSINDGEDQTAANLITGDFELNNANYTLNGLKIGYVAPTVDYHKTAVDQANATLKNPIKQTLFEQQASVTAPKNIIQNLIIDGDVNATTDTTAPMPTIVETTEFTHNTIEKDITPKTDNNVATSITTNSEKIEINDIDKMDNLNVPNETGVIEIGVNGAYVVDHSTETPVTESIDSSTRSFSLKDILSKNEQDERDE